MVVDGVSLYIQNIPLVFCKHSIQVSSKKWRLKINEFRSYCEVHIGKRFVFWPKLFFANNINTSVRSFDFSLLTKVLYI